MKTIRYCIVTVLIAVILFESYVLGCICLPRDVFRPSYQSVLQDKYRILKETDEPKIIVVAGSSTAFGLDQKMLEDASGYKVANLGLHAGYGLFYPTELSKANINEGDIVLLAYEYTWLNEGAFDELPCGLLMSAIDGCLEMYKYIPVEKWDNFIGYLPQYLQKKRDYVKDSGVYSRSAFDEETAQMIYNRDTNFVYTEDSGVVDIKSKHITDDTAEYLIGYKEYVEERGAKIYFVSPPICKKSIEGDYSEFARITAEEEEKIGIPYISDPCDYLFGEEYLYNTIYHCNNAGEKRRTEQLIQDLRCAGIIK